MNRQLRAISAEFIKNRHTHIRWVTFAAFALAPIFGGVFMIMMKDNGYDAFEGLMKSKAILFSIEASWPSLLSILSQAVGIGGIIIFGFVASWLFGREYSDKTYRDILALPISRLQILNAKFVYYIIWCLALVISNLILGLIIGFLLQLDGWSYSIFYSNLKTYFLATFLIIILNMVIAFFAVWGRGYLTPLAVVIILLVFAQILAAMGLGIYFPWSVPGIFAGSGGEELKMQLNGVSYILLIITGLAGYLATLAYWKYSDQK